MTEIQLPHSAKAERALLGALLINPQELSQIDLMPSDFYEKNNGAIYSAMIALDLQGINVDVVSVMNALQSMNKLDEVGGFDYLAGLANDVPSSLNAQTYADIVKDKSNRRKIIIKSQTLAQAAFDESKDVLEAVSETVESLVSNVNIGEGAKPISHVLNQLFDEVSNAMANPKEIYGMATGMPTFDKITRGLQKKEVAILAGEPGAGKSALAVQLGVGMAKGASGQSPHPGVIYELEMSALATVRRVIAYESRVQAYKLRSGKLEDDDVERFTKTTEQLSTLPIFISDYSNWTTMGIRADIAKLQVKHGVEWAIVDYLALLKDGYSEDANERSAIVSDRMHSIAKELDIAIIAVHDLNKASITGAIQGQAGLAGSRRIMYNADMIMFLKEAKTMQDNTKSFVLTWEKFREDEPDRSLELRRVPGYPTFVEVYR